jgi:hypothetical protein
MSTRSRSTRFGGAGKAKGISEVEQSAAEADAGQAAQVGGEGVGGRSGDGRAERPRSRR